MRVHFIAIGGAAMHNLAIALKQKQQMVKVKVKEGRQFNELQQLRPVLKQLVGGRMQQ